MNKPECLPYPLCLLSPYRLPRIIPVLPAVFLAACGPGGGPVNITDIPSGGAVPIRASVWADNWFAFYLGEQFMLEDSVPITTERSFNAETFTFNGDFPLQLNFVLKDFKENDTGLEYIGARNQQMGDGGFIAQFENAATGELLAYSDDSWKCLVIHEAPTDKSCEDADNPVPGVGACGFNSQEEPAGWKTPGFDDTDWPDAISYRPMAVDPKGVMTGVDWQGPARLIWSADLETHNTLLCRTTVQP